MSSSRDLSSHQNSSNPTPNPNESAIDPEIREPTPEVLPGDTPTSMNHPAPNPNPHPPPTFTYGTVTYSLDPITNQLVRSQRTNISPDGEPSDSGLFQARTTVSGHALGDQDPHGSHPHPPPGSAPGPTPDAQGLQHDIVETIMSTISAAMGSVPNPVAFGRPPQNDTVNTSTSGSSFTDPSSNNQAPDQRAPRRSNLPNMRSTIGVEDEDDMPSLMTPTPESSAENHPTTQSESRRTEVPIQHLFNAALEQQRQIQERDLRDLRERYQLDANADPNRPNPPATNGNGNPATVYMRRVNPGDPQAGAGNVFPGFGMRPGLMGSLMGLGMGMGMGMGGLGMGGNPLSMLNADRPPDTRRAKELLKGLTVVPHGLVRRLERVEALNHRMTKEKSKLKGDVIENPTASEGNAIGDGRLLCPVCYDPLLPDPDPEEATEEAMEVDNEEDDDEMDAKPDISESGQATESTATTPSASTSTATVSSEQPSSPPTMTKKKARQPHPYQAPNALIALPCTHIFHASSCLKPWFETGKTTCPTCRFDVDPRSETLDLNWLANAVRRRPANQNQGQGHNQNQAPANSVPAATPGEGAIPTVQPTVDGTPGPVPNPNANANGNATSAPIPGPPGIQDGGGGGMDYRTMLDTALRSVLLQAMTAAMANAQAQGNDAQGDGDGGAQAEGNQGPEGLQTGETQGQDGQRPPPSPQALAFQRAFDYLQQTTAAAATAGTTTAQPPRTQTGTGTPSLNPGNPADGNPTNDAQTPGGNNPSTSSGNPANNPTPSGNPPNNPAPSGNPANNPSTPSGNPRPAYDVLVRDIFVSNREDGDADVFMRDMLLPSGMLPGFDWMDMPVGPGPGAANGGGEAVPPVNNTGAPIPPSSTTGVPMEGVESTNSPSVDSARPTTSPAPTNTSGTRGSFNIRRAAYFTPNGEFVPAARPGTGTSASGSSGTHQTNPADSTTSGNQDGSTSSSSNRSVFGPPRPRTPIPGSVPRMFSPYTSRPPTPSSSARHHPYASPRSSNLNPTGSSSRGIGTDEPNSNSNASNTPGGQDGSADGNPGENVSFSRHSITFSFSFGPGPGPGPEGQGQPQANGNGNPTQNGPMPFPEGLMMGGDIIFGMGPVPPTGFGPGVGAGATRPSRSTRPKKKWVAPEGTSLRSVVEAKEREVGLRCDDVSCLWGPEDDDDLSTELKIREARVWLKKRGSDGLLEPSCAHRFHPECLLVAGRVADQHLEEEIEEDGGDDAMLIEAACPFCRARGALRRDEWKDARESVENM